MFDQINLEIVKKYRMPLFFRLHFLNTTMDPHVQHDDKSFFFPCIFFPVHLCVQQILSESFFQIPCNVDLLFRFSNLLLRHLRLRCKRQSLVS